MTWTLPAAAAALLLAAVPIPAGDAKRELEKFQGLWSVAAETSSGIAVPADRLKGRQLEVKGNRYNAKSPATGGELGTFALDPDKKPRAIDLTHLSGEEKGKTELGIYEVSGDTAQFCVSEAGKERPTAFSTTKDDDRNLFVIKRKKS